MAKGPLSDFPVDSGRPGRPGSLSKSSSNTGSSSRASVLSSVVPYLRRLDNDDMPPHQKPPLLTLKLSSPSFLDSFVTDDVIEQPLYTIRTAGTTTTIKRADPWDGDTKTAEIRWPKAAPVKGKGVSDGVFIQMRGGPWQGSEALLRRGTTILSGLRKFNIPNYSQSLKWRRVGSSYWCTTAAVKGPIAIFEPAMDSQTPRLNVFETLHDKHDARPMLVHHGVSILLLDYLLVTALFLVTDVQEWMLVKKFEGPELVIPIGNPEDLSSLMPPQSAPGNISTTDLQWRKIMYGEPLYPKRASRSPLSSGETTPDTLTPTLISAEQMAKVVYGHPLYPTLRSSSPAPSTSGSEDANDLMFFSPAVTRPPSPSSESIFYPHSRGSAPSHTYIDPTFYNDENEIPPVPPIPARFSTPNSTRSPHSRPSSSHSIASASSQYITELPLPPVLPLVPRPRSTPPRPIPSPTTARVQPDITGSPSGSLPPRRPSRQLPQPPIPGALPPEGDNRYPQGMGRARSQSQSHSLHDGEKWHSHSHPHVPYSQRTLPSPPTSSSRGAVPRVVSDSGPVKEDDVARWMDALTSPRAYAPLPLAMASTVYDMPPPAYNTINFSPSTPRAPGAVSTPPT